MKRRTFIRNSALASLAIGSGISGCTVTSKNDAEIIILGAGIAGLSLAYQLQKAGKDIILLEGSHRLGGRLYSHPKLKREVGGRGIGDKYTEVMKLIDEFNVELIDITKSLQPSKKAVYLDNKLYPTWNEKTTSPARLEFSKQKEAEKLDSLDDWFKRTDLDEAYSDFLKKLGHSKEEVDLINISANYNDVYETSSINNYHSTAFRQFNGTRRIFNFKGGTQSFIQAISKALTIPVVTGKKVEKIVDNGKNISIDCSDGKSYKAKKVVSTLPFSTLRDVEIVGHLNANQQEAIAKLPYTLITQIHLQADPYWKEDDAPLAMWTDTPLERIMSTNPDEDAGELVCWINGKGTSFFDEMSDNEIAHFTINELKKMRPSSEGKVEYVGTHKWGKYPFNKGAYCEFGVGHAALFEDMIRPAGNIHFAGEHTARNSRGIEGAAASAVRVFNELID